MSKTQNNLNGQNSIMVKWSKFKNAKVVKTQFFFKWSKLKEVKIVKTQKWKNCQNAKM